MISLLPIILLGTMTPSVDHRYNYQATGCAFRYQVPIAENGNDYLMLEMSLNGTLLFNNSNSYRYNIDEVDINLIGYSFGNQVAAFTQSYDVSNFYFGGDYEIYLRPDFDNDVDNGILLLDFINDDSNSIVYSVYYNRDNFSEGIKTFLNNYDMQGGYIESFKFAINDNSNTYFNSAFSNILQLNRYYQLDSDSGFQAAYDQGYYAGIDKGHDIGYQEGYDLGFNEGKIEGYNIGFDEGFNADETALTIFDGILSIAMIPVSFFLEIFNFDILGINFTGFITSMLTLGLILILLRTIFSGGNKE